MKGKFITFEGTDGCGKTTVIKEVVKKLEADGKRVVVTREPGGVSISEQIRDVLHDNRNTEMDPICEALLYAASRRQHLKEKVLPLLEEGTIVICDRYIDSSLAYQGYARGIGVEKVRTINEFAIDGFYPDLTVFIDVPSEVGLARIHANEDTHEVNRMDNESKAFHARTHEGYEMLLKMYPDRIQRVDGTKTIEEVSESAFKVIKEIL